MTYYPIQSTSSFATDDSTHDGYNFFLIDATSGNIIVTLAATTWDGNYFRFHRDDSSVNTVTIQVASGSGHSIYTPAGLVSSIALDVNEYIDTAISVGNVWYAPIVIFQ